MKRDNFYTAFNKMTDTCELKFGGLMKEFILLPHKLLNIMPSIRYCLYYSLLLQLDNYWIIL